MEKDKVLISEPKILTANTFYWSPGMNARNRRSNENRRQSEVYNFFSSLGFDVSQSGDSIDAVGDFDGIGKIEVHFHYSESCANVYKNLSIYRDGKKSNITTLRKLY